MPKRIDAPTRVAAAGNKVKVIEEYIGRVNTKDTRISVAVMQSPEGWEEPGQRPEFDEYTLVLEGSLMVEHADGVIEVRNGQAVETKAGEWVRYRTPKGAKYVAICLPAFSRDTVHRDE